MGNPSKDSDSGTMEGAESITARKAVAREMAKADMHYHALFNERSAAAMPTSLKMTSRALGFKVIDLFDWTKDKAIYQRWQMWSEKLDMPFKQWKVIQKRLEFHISTTGLTVKKWLRLSHGRIARHSLAKRTMRNLKKIQKKASTL